ncbi:hypothetical protein COCCADRAFT_92797 [Bipolaris zeicola 26-R-13]|uniref:Zn(2)-C6 fungal-type domain-containing protein n=1 Tax=Cochliobolus carbonum (strain 26-R-13) TaxID=930089 RepID=W6YT78_COCC2|nr:uncharacterized protein COCCADRAFT_92797 [Bipolaris zeicola 26-R-13]EUC34691.1 hypothetical protein COCCADRAFT_92797 [Bipolaris zeicola 26-R-13]
MQSPVDDTSTQRPSQARHTRQKGSRSKNDACHYWGLTCANCRIRKMRCGGGQPRCKTCDIYGDKCRYDKTPPMSQIIAMAQRLQEAEETIGSLRAQHSASSQSDVSPQTTSTITGPLAAAIASPDVAPAEEPPAFKPNHRPTNLQMSCPSTSKDHLLNLSLDENGDIQYYGPTSAIHDPPQLQLPSQTSQACSTPPGTLSTTEIGSKLTAHYQESKIWEDFAIGNASLQTGIPRQVMVKLLHMHWTWVSPMFMYVYRPGDMATGGRYYSELLLTVICAHAAKYQNGDCAEFLQVRMRRLLGTAIQQPSSIPTVQALLQLSARELANGSISQAWVYSGIAFRMASDLGLQHCDPGFRRFGPVDAEVRKRLFWSCYFWDKAISMYTGRLPAITESLPHSTLDQLDDSMELESWSPYYGDPVDIAKLTQSRYAPQTSRAVSCFANSCKLSIIINDIISQLYSRRSREITESALRDIKVRLDVWRAESPAHLRYEPDYIPAVSPPPHIVSQNLLYYTAVILAHRPFWSVPAHYETCIAAAHGIERLVLLLDSTFGLENITYLMGYCIYTGASAVLEDAQRCNQGAAHPVLRTFLRALNAGMRLCPILERSLNIIIRSLSHVPLGQHQQPLDAGNDQGRDTTNPSADAIGGHTNSYIPAFPYLHPELSVDFSMVSQVGEMDFGSMAALDCFPEMWLDSRDAMSM